MNDIAARQAGNEVLVSFVLVATGQTQSDIEAVERIAEFAKGRFDFYELMLLASAPGRDWLDKVREAVASVANIRVIVLEQKQHYDDAVYQALQLSIGDIVICDEAISASPEVFAQLFDSVSQGNHELVKTVAADAPRFSPSAMLLWLVKFGLFAFMGRRIETNVLRAICVNRSAATRITESNDALRYFRLLNLGDQFREDRVAVAGSGGTSRLEGLVRKSQISAFLVSAAAMRILSGITVLALLLCILSLSYTLYTGLVWLFFDQVSEGWTSLSLVLSVLFAANFGVLAAVCLGVMEVLRNSRAERPPTVMQEINNADLFAQARNLNIEIADNG